MNDFGMPPDGGLPNAAADRPPNRPGNRSPLMPALLLVLACAGLGAMLSWGNAQRKAQALLRERNRGLEDAYSVVIAQRDDLAAFLTDPRTRLYHLTGRSAAAGHSAIMAWQSTRGTGFFMGDRMPLPADSKIYRIWQGSRGSRSATPADRAFRPEPGLTCVEFHVLGDSPGSTPDRFFLTLETDRRSAGPSADIAYETGPAPTPSTTSPVNMLQ